MKRLLELELKKAFHSKWFAGSLAIGIVCVSINAYNTVARFYGEGGTAEYIEYCIRDNIVPKIGLEYITLYNSWLGATADMGTILFFYLVPLIAILPCGWNIAEEIHNGYLKVMVPRVGRRRYFSAKLIAAFLSGGTAVTAALLFSLGITAALVPATLTRPYDNMYYWVSHGDIFSALAFSHPLIYALIYILIDFVFAGLFACLPLVVALHNENRVASLIIPYIVLILCDSARQCLNYISYIEISPLNLMRSLPPENAAKSYVVIAWFAVFAAVSLIFGLRKGEKREIV